MDIQQLRYFVAVAEERHFGRAAERLHLTASPLSRRIRELERELGADLFVRGYHTVELTAVATEFLPAARDVLERFDALRAFGSLAADAVPTRRIGATPLAPPGALDLVLDTLAAVRPAVDADLTLEPSQQLFGRLAAGRLDLAVVHLPVDVPGLDSLPIGRYRFAVAMRADDEFAGRDSVDIGELTRRQVLMISGKVHPAAVGNLRRFLIDAGITRIVDLPHDDAVQVAAHITRYRSLSLVLGDPRQPGARVFDGPEYAVVPLRDPGPLFEVGVAWPAERALRDPVLAEVLAELRRATLQRF
ncbi:LysR family transcriptional regulator [Cryptosporangium aurantiacum]|uniref:Transcriptional regulator, LysR family n=1 Tax=Cryptosporangium aurantiacum TaxID=134849 RepID=A0A1M7PIP4_9ACTN|nr:LysR family transcriptional regulator [Cryptosporangium aurantiacum]SHN16969.1 transcriptional regulator, LysR family [Cryptosporangium aurantiacum]